jgi:hypothetical protein
MREQYISRRDLLRMGAGVAWATAYGCTRTSPTLGPVGVTDASVYDIRDYGAVGDGVASDSAAFKAAIEAAFRTGGTVYVPSGLYRQTTQIRLKSGIVLDMDPNAILIRDYLNSGVEGTEASMLRNDDWASGNSKITVRGGQLRSSGPSVVGKLMGFKKTLGLEIRGVQFTGVHGDWNTAFQDCEDVLIEGVRMRSGKLEFEDGLHFMGGKRILVTNCDIDCGDDCLSFTQNRIVGADIIGDIEDVTVTNVILRSRYASLIKISKEPQTSGAIRRITIRNVVGTKEGATAGRPIVIEDLSAEKSGQVHDITLENIAVNCTDSSGDAVVLSAVDNITLRKVRLTRPHGHGFNLYNCNSVTADLCETTLNRGSNVHGLLARKVTSLTVTGGEYSGASGHGMVVGQRADTVSAWVVEGVSLRRNAHSGIRLAGARDGQAISNLFDGNGAGIGEDAGSDYNRIARNDFRNQSGTKVTVSGPNTSLSNNVGLSG